jgi:hypothetical protein
MRMIMALFLEQHQGRPYRLNNGPVAAGSASGTGRRRAASFPLDAQEAGDLAIAALGGQHRGGFTVALGIPVAPFSSSIRTPAGMTSDPAAYSSAE